MIHHFTTFDWTGLPACCAATIMIGLFFSRKNRSGGRFISFGRSLPGWVWGLPVSAPFLPDISFLALRVFGGIAFSPFFKRKELHP